MNEFETRNRDAATARPAVPPAAGRGSVEPAAMLGAGSDEGSFGRALAAAREARGLSQGDVAAQLRLQSRQVKAIESEDLGALPEGPFVRGYVRNFAKLVDLPAEPLLQLLNARLKPTDPLPGAAGRAAAVSPIQQTPREPWSGRVVIGAVLALLIAFAAFGWWAMRSERPTTTPATPAVGAAPPEPAPAEPAPVPAVTPADAAAAGSTQAAAAPAGNSLRLTFRGRSWVEIRQSDGAVLMSQNNLPGTVQTVDGLPPFTLVIGNASQVDLEFRGKAVDLAAGSSRDDVARLTLE